jgi:hypothetical protein
MTNYQNRIEVLELDFDGKFLNFKVICHGSFYQLHLTSKVKAEVRFHFGLKKDIVDIEHPKDFHMGVRGVCSAQRLFNVLRNKALTLPSDQL